MKKEEIQHGGNTSELEIIPFRMDISEKEIKDLQERLAKTRWAPELKGVGWSRGVPLAYIKDLVEYWQSSFDWRKQEKEWNKFPQYTTVIDGQKIHFLHVQSLEPDAIPLMLIHGWPGSFLEFQDVIGPLTNPRAHDRNAENAYHLVIPSVPGFGFSGPLTEPGWNIGRIAAAFHELMERLGYEKYGVQGGDTGAFIAPEMGQQKPEKLIGIHVNSLLTFPQAVEGEMDNLSETEYNRLQKMETFNDGYLQIQSKSPQTLAYGLHDSPAGQLAWIVDLYKNWTEPRDSLPEDSIDKDLILTNVSLYWFTGTAGSSAQIYYESTNDPSAWEPKPKGTVPTGVLVSINNDVTIRSFAERDHNIVHWSEFEQGGHFFALEQPHLFVRDVCNFFSKVK